MLNIESTGEKKIGGDKKKKKKKKQKEKEIWSGTDGMYDATRYIYKEKEDGVERFFYMY
jgi:hypothetical protein